jgi:hypothetical protein
MAYKNKRDCHFSYKAAITRLESTTGAPLKNQFSDSARPDPAEKILHDMGCVFSREPDGTLVVEGDLKISYRRLTELPDLSNVVVKGDFCCNDNLLSSLKGAPKAVGGDFWCQYNFLDSLEGAPKIVGHNFWCHNNHLASLEHAPSAIGGYFYCGGNDLASLEHAPKSFIKLTSDFGDFTSWNEVPESLRFSPETKARMEREKAQQHLRELAAKHPLRLKKTAAK